jgi:hypothetical protein
MKQLVLAMTISIALAAQPIFAQGEATSDIKPSFSASQTVTATSRVEAINHETREVTLRLENGELFTSQVSEEARNLDQVSVGDVVYAHYTESVSIRVVESDGAEPEAYVEEDLARSGEGRMPGVAATESTVTTAIVEEINLDDNTFKLREPDGEVRQYTARNPNNLRMAEVGDKVITTVTTSVVITVESRPAE